MYPSYPEFRWQSDIALKFAVPNNSIVLKILDDSEQDENLRVLAAGNLLCKRVTKLAELMSRHRIQVKSMEHNELGITLFLPPPLCPPPGNLMGKLKKFTQILKTIVEQPREEETVEKTFDRAGREVPQAESAEKDSEWVTLYEYLPADKRHGMCGYREAWQELKV